MADMNMLSKRMDRMTIDKNQSDSIWKNPKLTTRLLETKVGRFRMNATTARDGGTPCFSSPNLSARTL